MIDSKLAAAFSFARQHGSNASRAIELARADVAEGRTRYPATLHARDSAVLPGKRTFEGWNRESNGTRYVENLKGAGLRLVGYADELARRIDHKGWYTDSEFQGDTLRGVVLALPAKDGMPRYMAGYEESANGGIVVDVSPRFTVFYGGKGGAEYPKDDYTVRDVARAADGFAERAAEKEREYQDAWRLGSDYADALAEAKESRTERRQLVRELKATRRNARAAGVMIPQTVCDVLLGRVARLRADAQAAYDRAQSILSDNPYAPADAFNEGAGFPVMGR